MDYRKEFRVWLNSPFVDGETKKELESIKEDEKEIRDRFFKHLEFGTAGLRGKIGAGTNRMNVYTVSRATQGLANYIRKSGEVREGAGVVIAYDSRHMSRQFALRAALVLNGNGIKAFLFDDIKPTPQLSFAVRELGALAGIMITASHNPPEYNGYKVYWKDGGQITPERAVLITREINGIRDFGQVSVIDMEEAVSKGLLVMIGEEMDDRYISRVVSLCLNREMVKKHGGELKVVYTPLHGTGRELVARVLERVGFSNTVIVKEQAVPDPGFSTVKSLNPEEREALTMALQLAGQEEGDIVLATDPDCDRLSMAVRNDKGQFVHLTGNQIGALMVDYILSQRKMLGMDTPKDVIIKTIVTSELGRVIARSYGADTLDTLTGFKFIAERMEEFSKTGKKNFVFGYEESSGFLAGDFVRDKDGVIASLVACEMALYYKLKGLTLHNALEDIYRRYGYHMERVRSFVLEGKEGLDRIKHIMQYFRDNGNKINELLDGQIEEVRDYMAGKGLNVLSNTEKPLDLPKADVLYYRLQDGCWFCVRPSGTEPKIKLYFASVDRCRQKAVEKLKAMEDTVMNFVKDLVSH